MAPSSVRERFARLVGNLHLRARAPYAENEVLNRLHGRLLDSFLDGAPDVEGTH
ncbi:hypothetical protein ACIPDW_07135 [Streptomyces sp. NPDC087290]|uniref:hypothetical protein n=1 Tax=Streptomyces sp. NPDC087290 TaxID=3365776 RepID=UPI00380669AC